MPKETEKEKIVNKQSTTMINVALISSATTLLVSLITAFLAFPPFQAWVYSWGNEQKVEPLGIEHLSPRIFAYYGEAENAGGFGRLELIFNEITSRPTYELSYNLPDDKTGYAGIAFQLGEGSDLSGYNAVECTVIFGQAGDVIDLYFKDIAGHFNTIRVSNNGANEMLLRFEFSNFPDINFNAVKEFGMVISTDFSTGSHKVRIQNIGVSP